MNLACAIFFIGLFAGVAVGQVSAFRADILPVLTRAGCNTGACHGAASGQGGLRLSLFGYDSQADFQRITREFGGRRVDLSRPEESLLLRKASDTGLDHEGGRKLPQDSKGYALLREWIAAGAPEGNPELAVSSITVDPSDLLLEIDSPPRQLCVIAKLTDGSSREVSTLALYTSNEDAVAEVTGEGALTVTGRGLTSIMVRYGGHVAAVRVAVPLSEVGDDVALHGFAAVNFIDDHIHDGLKRMRMVPAALCDDAEFLRRASLDLTGRLPDEAAARAFLKLSGKPEQRGRMIEQLLASEAYHDFWTLKLADLLLLDGKGAAANEWHRWLREQVAANTPLDRVARALLTAVGNPSQNGPAGFMLLANDPRDLAEHVTRIFLGTQLGCARCHAHPSDRWTQDDFHRFAAFFARLNRDGGMVRNSPHGEVDDPKTGRPLTPKTLGGNVMKLESDAERRTVLAGWLTTPENPFFARTLVNRVWKHLCGSGLIEPVDDLRPTNPATHPALLDALAADFSGHGFDLRRLIRLIVSSRTWQSASSGGSAGSVAARLFARSPLKELTAAVFVDAVAQVTGVPTAYEGYPIGTRAVQLVSPATPAPALDVLGRCERKRSCEGGARSLGGGLAQALHLINGSTINEKLHRGLVDELTVLPNRELLETLYLRAFTRFATPEEFATWDAELPAGPARTDAVEDLLWTVLNSREFGTNH